MVKDGEELRTVIIIIYGEKLCTPWKNTVKTKDCTCKRW